MSVETANLSDLARQDVQFHLHSQTNLPAHRHRGPLVMCRGDGIRVYDEAGNEYIESMSGLWCAALGFSDRRLAAAATRQLETLPYYHTFNHRVPDVVARLAERVAALVPVVDPKIFFASSGSEANDTMTKIAWSYHRARGKPERRKMIAHTKGFHGATVMGASLSGLPHMHGAFGLPVEGILHVECPHFYRNGRANETEADFVARLVGDLEALIAREGAGTIAAFISEPILGAGGVIVPPAGYFPAVQNVLRKHGILMLSDEIICGFGRTGDWFGAQGAGFVPDMMSCAKTFSSGYVPISAVVVSGDIYSALESESAHSGPFGHGFTYSGHPVAAAVALEAVTIYQEMNAPARTRELGAYLHDRLASLAGHPLVGEIRGRGLIAGIELVSDKETRACFPSKAHVGAAVEARARAHGLIVRNMGDVIALSPPFIVTPGEIDLIVQKLARALDEAGRSPQVDRS
ncbi:aminotransferase [Burkholderia sp. WSM2232]|uniref:aminotransferase n=1 Tax=Burkholderia sp. WSM2232 TaxID=944436 RepID=UPI000409D45A|nr:aminotransferase [Burkholderia sp. WSM2232]